MTVRRHYTFALAFALALGGAACSGDDHDHEHGVEEEFCEHFQDGPFQTVTASLDAAGAPDATFEHTRVNITLTATTGGNGGYVAFEADEEAEFIFALSAEAPLVLSQGGTVVDREATEANDFCTEVVRMDTYDLEAGTYQVWIGPTAESTIGFGFEEAGGEHDHDHE